MVRIVPHANNRLKNLYYWSIWDFENIHFKICSIAYDFAGNTLELVFLVARISGNQEPLSYTDIF